MDGESINRPCTRNLIGPIFFKSPNSILLAIAFSFCGAALGTAEVDFADREALEQQVSDNGTISLSWNAPDAQDVVLEQDATPQFAAPTLRYQGADSGAVLTGLPEGIHYFRVGLAQSGEWSSPLKMEVRFLERSTLYLLLGIGALVVGATVGAIFAGHTRTRDREAAAS